MAISLPHYRALKTLTLRGDIVPPNPRILEIGEACVYDDSIVEAFRRDLQSSGDATAAAIDSDLSAKTKSEWIAWDIAKGIYRFMFGAGTQVTSIDLHGTPAAYKRDLNTATFDGDEYDIVYNHGTAEHIFNIANVFRFMHDACRLGGLMIHEAPFTGWVDHGFWTIQPTAYYDLARANNYEIVYFAVTHIELRSVAAVASREHLLSMVRSGTIANNSMLYVVLRRMDSWPLRMPMQGLYDNALSDEAVAAWRDLR